ncbi:MAG: NUDIX domain-containing protein, partial [Thermoprotei archaeon]
FGEYSVQALKREILEETHTVVEDVRFLGVLENIFVYNGVQQHEVDFVYDGVFPDESVYSKGRLEFVEGASKMTAKWIPLSKLAQDKQPLYPGGLLQLLKEQGYS